MNSPNTDSPEERALDLLEKTRERQLIRRYQEAQQAALEALELIRATPLPHLLARGLNLLGSVQIDLLAFSDALLSLQEALSVAKSTDNWEQQITAIGSIGTTYRTVGDYAPAMDYFDEALRMSQEIGYKIGEIRYTSGLGIIYQNLGKSELAYQYFSRSLELERSTASAGRMASLLGNMGIVCMNLGRQAEAIDFSQQAIRCDLEIGNEAGLARHYGNIATMYLEDSAQAMSYYEKALEIDSRLGHRMNRMAWTGQIAMVYADPKFPYYDPAKAEALALSVIEECKEMKYPALETQLHKMLAELFERQERWREVAGHFKRYHALDKEMQDEQFQQRAQSLEYRRQLEDGERDRQLKLAAFQEKEKLLHNVLPAQIAERIAGGEKQIADYFPAVSILFADIEGFTPLSADMPAHIVVQFLNHIFSSFDQIVKQHGVEKIKTIGDGYMAIAGAPEECADHAERITRAAFDMLKVVDIPENIRLFLPEDVQLSIRIGLHTGSVVAGVVGEERFMYDVYSDAVNIAARMESHGESGRIHVSADFMKHLLNRFVQTKNETHGIRFEKRGEIEVKGKGEMKTYFLSREE